MECANCHTPLDVGEDVLVLVHGVVGTRGNAVPVEDEAWFCGEECLHEHDDDRPRMKRRVP